MAEHSKISWTDTTWSPVTGCDRVSEGCNACYALTLSARLKAMGQPKYQRDGDPRTSGPGFGLTLHRDVVDEPLRWRKPRRVFVCSMSDLFHPQVPDGFIFDVLAVIAMTPQHIYQVLTKRPQRMARLFADERTPGRVATAVDRLTVRREIEAMGDVRQRQIDGYPGYWITDRGAVLLEGGSEHCVWCTAPIPESRIARARFCSQPCNSKAHYEASQGRWTEPESFRPLRPDAGQHGHQRASMVAADGVKRRELVHRLVLTAFRRPGEPGEEGCHRDGDPANNALPNLRWGTHSDNWVDRVRHGNQRSHSKLTAQQVEEIKRRCRANETRTAIADRFGISDTQVRNIERGDQWAERSDWPLPNLHAATSIESDRYAFRADHLRATPAAVRFLSLEPLLGPLPSLDLTGIDWCILGGESGPKARPMDVGWVRELRDRCADSGVAVWVKQLGAVWAREHGMRGAAAEPDNWPADLRVQEFPGDVTRNACRYCAVPIPWSAGLFCSDAHAKAAKRRADEDTLGEFRATGPVVDGEQGELA